MPNRLQRRECDQRIRLEPRGKIRSTTLAPFRHSNSNLAPGDFCCSPPAASSTSAIDAPSHLPDWFHWDAPSFYLQSRFTRFNSHCFALILMEIPRDSLDQVWWAWNSFLFTEFLYWPLLAEPDVDEWVILKIDGGRNRSIFPSSIDYLRSFSFFFFSTKLGSSLENVFIPFRKSDDTRKKNLLLIRCPILRQRYCDGRRYPLMENYRVFFSTEIWGLGWRRGPTSRERRLDRFDAEHQSAPSISCNSTSSHQIRKPGKKERKTR